MGNAKRMVVLALAAMTACGPAAAQDAAQQKATCWAWKRDATASIAACTALIEAGGLAKLDLADTFLRRGAAYGAVKQYSRAFADFSETIRLDPENFNAFHNRGAVAVGLGRLDQAIADIGQANALDPGNAWGLSERCRVLVYARRLREALADCDEAVRLAPAKAYSLLNRGIVYLRMRRPDPAMADFESLLGREPQLADALYGRGMARAMKGDADGGAADIAAANKANPDVAQYYAQHDLRWPVGPIVAEEARDGMRAQAAEILWGHPSEAKAMDAVADLERLADSGDVEAQLWLGRMYWTGDYVAIDVRKAIRLLKDAADQGSVEAQWSLGEAYASGILGPRDYAEMAKWYLMAARAGDVRAQFAIAQLAAPQDYIRSIWPSAEPVLPKDEAVALGWLEKAANGGWPAAQRQLAYWYALGLGVPQDAEKYALWMNRGIAAIEPALPPDFDFAEFMNAMVSGRRGGQSPLAAIDELDKPLLALSRRGYGYFGWVAGYARDGLLTQLPKGDSAFDRNRLARDAVAAYRSSAEAGYPGGMEGLGDALTRGRGVAKDVKRGRDLLRQAALKGDGNAAGWLVWDLGLSDDDLVEAYVWGLIGGKLGAAAASEGLRLHVLDYISPELRVHASAYANRLAGRQGLEFYRQGDHRYWCNPVLPLLCR